MNEFIEALHAGLNQLDKTPNRRSTDRVKELLTICERIAKTMKSDKSGTSIALAFTNVVLSKQVKISTNKEEIKAIESLIKDIESRPATTNSKAYITDLLFEIGDLKQESKLLRQTTITTTTREDNIPTTYHLTASRKDRIENAPIVLGLASMWTILFGHQPPVSDNGDFIEIAHFFSGLPPGTLKTYLADARG